ncbi:MAG: DUF4212 domain-containing protein [Chloroflexi bacterium]|nr:DUF4212 domain-containing protein [Chloroflexota bacterium]
MATRTPPPTNRSVLQRHWRENLTLIAILLLIWAAASLLHPPFAKALNSITILTGFPLGYWLASQAGITVFVILIFFYALYMNNVLDRKYGLHDEEE